MTATVFAAALALVATLVWLGAGVWLAVVDYRTRTLPTRVIWGAAAAVWVLYTAASLVEATHVGLLGAAIGAAACGGFLAAIYLVHPPSMGFGDVRLSVLNGLICGWWGWQAALLGLTVGFTLALPEALVMLLRHGPKASRPLGPYLVAGTGVVLIWLIATRGLIPISVN